MKRRLLAAFAATLVLAGCGKPADKPIASGDGFGREWSGAPGQVRIAVNNRLTRELIVHVEAPGAHYAMTIAPGHQRHTIIPTADYKFSAYYFDGKSVGNFYIETEDRNGAKGLLLDIANP